MSYLVSTFYKGTEICKNVYNACNQVYKGSETVQNVRKGATHVARFISNPQTISVLGVSCIAAYMIQRKRLIQQQETLNKCFKNYNEQHYNPYWERDSFKSKKHTNFKPFESDSEDESDSYYDVTNCKNRIHKNPIMISHDIPFTNSNRSKAVRWNEYVEKNDS